MADEPETAPAQNGQPAGEPRPPSDAAASTAPWVLDTVRRLLQGGVDTVTGTLEEITESVQRLVGRGAIPDAELKQIVQEYVEQRPADGTPDDPAARHPTSTALAPLDKSQSALERSVETILVRLNVPTRGDIENLSRKITLLNEKVTRLKELRESGREAGVHPSAESGHGRPQAYTQGAHHAAAGALRRDLDDALFGDGTHGAHPPAPQHEHQSGRRHTANGRPDGAGSQ
jgi:poly(hydroxyalkanoate) granule-associated protein